MERSKSHFEGWRGTWIDRYFDMPLWGRAVLMGSIAALLMLTMDEVAHAFGYPWFLERLFENFLEGIVIGGVVYWLGVVRKKRIERRVKEITFLNHHIRNAMQSIELVATRMPDTQQRQVLDTAVRRVVETLARIGRSDELILDSSLYAG